MSKYYYPEEIKADLHRYPQFRDKLYCRGFLLTDKKVENLSDYPFYGNWNECKFQNSDYSYFIYSHKENNVCVHESNGVTYFLIGHAYNPFDTETREERILCKLSEALNCSETAFWEKESELTGVFCIGFASQGDVTFSTDATGMQLTYYGVVDNHLYVTSHSKLVADIEGLEHSVYIRRLTASRLWPLWGQWLPADVSPFAELKRMVPNCKATYQSKQKCVSVERYFPTVAIPEAKTEEEFEDTIHELGRIMANTMACIAGKWPEKKIAVSVTGGKDSMTTLSCSRDNYDKFSYFSYISNEDEAVDAYAARDILGHLGLEHVIIEIPKESEDYKGIEVFRKVMQCNNGCTGANNENDLKKRMFFIAHPPCDIEVKSWVNEIGRGWEYNKYNKKRFPKYPYPSYWRTMHKAYVNPWIIKETDKVFTEYMNRYYSKEVFEKLSWTELYFWEFTCSASEGSFLTTEHKVSYDITIPFNNRIYIAKMMTVPIEKRKTEGIPNALIQYMEPRILETGISIHDVSHTNFRAFALKIYLAIFSKIRF